MAVQQNITFLRPIETGDTVKDSGLTGAVGANDAVDRSLGNLEVQALDSRLASKPFGQLLEF